MSNKKSFVQDWLLVPLVIILLLGLFLYVSLGNFNRQKTGQENAASQVIVKDSNQLLLNYLKSPVDSDKSHDADVADLINYYYINKNDGIFNQLRLVTEEFFTKSSIETDYSSYSIEITFPDKEFVIESEKSRTQQVLRKELARTIMPTSYNNRFIEIKLFIVTTKFVSK